MFAVLFFTRLQLKFIVSCEWRRCNSEEKTVSYINALLHPLWKPCSLKSLVLTSFAFVLSTNNLNDSRHEECVSINFLFLLFTYIFARTVFQSFILFFIYLFIYLFTAIDIDTWFLVVACISSYKYLVVNFLNRMILTYLFNMEAC